VADHCSPCVTVDVPLSWALAGARLPIAQTLNISSERQLLDPRKMLAYRRPAHVGRTHDQEEAELARRTIFVSDLTGKTIDEKDAATLTIKYADSRRGLVVLDVNANEVADLAAKGTKQARRGRKPKS
jgi:hypothetical protein